ncbi:hypothetical protein PG990_008672 [Apiospora arundinis]
MVRCHNLSECAHEPISLRSQALANIINLSGQAVQDIRIVLQGSANGQVLLQDEIVHGLLDPVNNVRASHLAGMLDFGLAGRDQRLARLLLLHEPRLLHSAPRLVPQVRLARVRVRHQVHPLRVALEALANRVPVGVGTRPNQVQELADVADFGAAAVQEAVRLGAAVLELGVAARLEAELFDQLALAGRSIWTGG